MTSDITDRSPGFTADPALPHKGTHPVASPPAGTTNAPATGTAAACTGTAAASARSTAAGAAVTTAAAPVVTSGIAPSLGAAAPLSPGRARGRCATARTFAAGKPSQHHGPRVGPLIPHAVRLVGPGLLGHYSSTRADSAEPVRCADKTDSEYDWPTLPGPARLDDPGEFLAAVPAMLGFLPERSLVLAVLCPVAGEPGGALVDLVVRFDLRHPRTGRPSEPATIAAAAARVCARPEVIGVLAVLVDESFRATDTPLPHHDPVLADLERRLAAAGVPIRGAWATPAIVAGRPWWSLRGPQRRGRVADPSTSPVTFGQVLDGRPVYRRRSELTELVAPDPALHEEVSAEFPGAVARAKERYAEAGERDDPVGYLKWQLEKVLWYVSQLASGEPAAPRELAEIAVALRDHEVRDAVFALADGVYAEVAEQLWARLARAVPGEYRAEAATLLGYFAYVRGDGPLAGIALDAALDAEPLHSMAVLLHTALEAGMYPERLRDLARCGREAAADLGVVLDDPR